MASKIWTFANPNAFMRLSARLTTPLTVLAVVALVGSMAWAYLAVPPDKKHGDAIKFIFIHVPAAMLAINFYAMMVIASAIGYVRGHHVSHLVAKAAAPIGAAFTVVAIVTGALWGKAGSGWWWVWDARLTSILILLFFYLGYMALWEAIEDPVKAADLTAILCLVGSVFAFLSRYASVFFPTMHQGFSLSLDADENVNNSFYIPLIAAIIGFYAMSLAMLLVGVRTEIRARRVRALRLAAG